MSTPTARPGESLQAYKDRIQREQPFSISAHQQLLVAARATIAFVEGKPSAVEPFGLLRAAIAAAEAHQAEPVRLTEAEIGRIDRQSREGIKSLMSTWPVPLARAIEDAVLERNGFNPLAKGD